MTKKQLIMQALEKLSKNRDMADDIMSLINSEDIDENTINHLINIISNAIKASKSQEEKTSLNKSIEVLQKLQKIQESEKVWEAELQAILDKIDG